MGLLATLTSTNGAPVAPVAIPGGLTKIWIHETFAADATGVLLGTTNLYTEHGVPEPVSLGIWSLLGLVGAASGWRRRRR